MKIICVGRNYAAHARELNNDVPENPVIFLKPDTALSKNEKPFYIPAFSSDIHFETEVVLRIGKNGKHIAAKFAEAYISDVGMGIDFTARDVQNNLKGKGLPWELSKAFDNAAVLGKMIPATEVKNLYSINFHLLKNGEEVQRGNTANLLFRFDKIISFVSEYITLNKGDLIYTGTPEGVGRVQPGDVLEGFMENEKFFTQKVK